MTLFGKIIIGYYLFLFRWLWYLFWPQRSLLCIWIYKPRSTTESFCIILYYLLSYKWIMCKYLTQNHEQISTREEYAMRYSAIQIRKNEINNSIYWTKRIIVSDNYALIDCVYLYLAISSCIIFRVMIYIYMSFMLNLFL